MTYRLDFLLCPARGGINAFLNSAFPTAHDSSRKKDGNGKSKDKGNETKDPGMDWKSLRVLDYVSAAFKICINITVVWHFLLFDLLVDECVSNKCWLIPTKTLRLQLYETVCT